MKKLLFSLIFLFTSVWLSGQQVNKMKKQQTAVKIDEIIKVDGILNEDSWSEIIPATGFIALEPNPGSHSTQKTEVKIAYDDKAIYVGAMLYDSHPDSILKELSQRDNLGNTDFFGVSIDAYQDGINGLTFIVTPADVQFDAKVSSNGEDENWDAVWKSEARITDKGWVVEMELPYSALRFPNAEEQVWNVNYIRLVRRNREKSFWSEINPEVDGYFTQAGHLQGIRNIKSPVRLSATPFLVTYLENYYDKSSDQKSSWGRSFNGGMDIKYGINDAFTLDMTLIPDFGQTQSDNQILNLSPFEVQFDENRAFFTEGIELFDKGGLFYSRRVGGQPLHAGDVEDQLADGEEIVDNPANAQLVNATKVSGRTKSGLGVGVFNATAIKTHAVIKNAGTNEERTVETSPLTNYNVLVFDQNLKNSSYVSLVNTNVTRFGSDYDANVTGTEFQLKNKKQSYGIYGEGAVSQKYFSESDDLVGKDSVDIGYAYEIGVGKISGNWNFELEYGVESYDYDINDLGFLRSPNEKGLSLEVEYNHFKPFGIFNNAGGGMWTGINRLHRPDKFTSYGVNFWFYAQTKQFTTFRIWTYFEPMEGSNYWEPRTADFSRYFKTPAMINLGGFMSTDYRKKFAINVNPQFRKHKEDGWYALNFWVQPRFRLSDKFSFQWSFGTFNTFNEPGYVNDDAEKNTIYFGRRDIKTFETVLNTTYTFNNKMGLTFRLRHYWSNVNYKSFHELTFNGGLAETDYQDFHDSSFNSFTIDAVYRWRFAPGSDIFIVWKNSISDYSDEQQTIQYNYGKGVNRLLDFPQSNSLSVKIIYFLDYLSMKK